MTLIDKISRQLHDELGYCPIRSKLIKVPSESWNSFCEQNEWDSSSLGAFSPSTLAAYIKNDTPYIDLIAIHEFIGHGLFFEFHCQGIIISKYKKELRQIDMPQKLKLFSELFAIWCEFYWGTRMGLSDQVNNRYLIQNDAQLAKKISYFNEIEKKFGLFGLFSCLGFPKLYDTTKLKSLIRRLFDKEKLKDTRLAILYGSKKAYSDIDLFFVSEAIDTEDYGWLDIVAKTKEVFIEQLSLFSVALRDVVKNGEYVYGDLSFYNKIKLMWENQPITNDAIDYNVKRHKYFKKLSADLRFQHEVRRRAKKYSVSFLQNALRLKQGIR